VLAGKLNAMEETFSRGEVQGVLHRPAVPGESALVLAHGAGADCHSELLVGFARAAAGFGWTVLRYDLPFRKERPKGPPHPSSAGRDRAAIRAAVLAVRDLGVQRVICGGHSYGGRQSTMLAAEEPGLVEGLLLLAYPLHPPRKREELRTGHFPQLRTPALFVHGTRDPFGLVEELREAMTLIPARTELLEVSGAGHDLKQAVARTAEILDRLRAIV
jgi:predicted alpha/beta-hydrolase family hydrolase